MPCFEKEYFERNKLILAPMAGVSDPVFRALCIEHGADLTYTEMISAKGLSYENEKTEQLLTRAENETHVVVQLFGHEPATLAAQAEQVAEKLQGGLAYIDINMGCPARKIVSKGDGSALLSDPVLAESIIRAVSRTAGVPVTVKIRRGFALGEDIAVPFARMAEQAGASAIAIHGRYSKQFYRGHADWGCVARVRQAVSIPVIGNGDITNGSDAYAMLNETGCDAVMIGRGAQGNPWIFADAQAAISGVACPRMPDYRDKIMMAIRHAQLLAQQGGRTLVTMRRHAMNYIAGLPHASQTRRMINECVTIDDFEHVLSSLLTAIEAERLQAGDEVQQTIDRKAGSVKRYA